MKSLLLFILFAVSVSAFANAGIFRGNGRTVVMDSTDKIQMVEEEVVMLPMRGNYPVDATCRNLDPMKFHCTFKLRNLSDKEVTIQVGFPLSGAVWVPKADSIHQTELIGCFGFAAGTKEKLFPVRYVPYDSQKKFSDLFLWDMTFKPKEEIQLTVVYTMDGYMGLGSLMKPELHKTPPEQKTELENMFLTQGQMHQYITETGGCWAGKIEKAVFRIYPFQFEEYLQKRGPLDIYPQLPNDEKRSRKYLWVITMLTSDAHLIRHWNPAFEKWTLVKGKKHAPDYLELVYQPFEPKGERDNLQFAYHFAFAFPRSAKQFDFLIEQLKKHTEKEFQYAQKALNELKNMPETQDKRELERRERIRRYRGSIKPYSPQMAKNLADAILEFYGIHTENPEIKDFLNTQIWYPAQPRPIQPELKARLEKASGIKKD